MNHILTLSSASSYFIIRQPPTEVTLSILSLENSLRAATYLKWIEPTNLYGYSTEDMYSAIEYYKHTAELYSWIVHNPDYKWGST